MFIVLGVGDSYAAVPKLTFPSLPNPNPPQWYVQAACATNGDGLYEGLDWLSRELAK